MRCSKPRRPEFKAPEDDWNTKTFIQCFPLPHVMWESGRRRRQRWPQRRENNDSVSRLETNWVLDGVHDVRAVLSEKQMQLIELWSDSTLHYILILMYLHILIPFQFNHREFTESKPSELIWLWLSEGVSEVQALAKGNAFFTHCCLYPSAYF